MDYCWVWICLFILVLLGFAWYYWTKVKPISVIALLNSVENDIDSEGFRVVPMAADYYKVPVTVVKYVDNSQLVPLLQEYYDKGTRHFIAATRSSQAILAAPWMETHRDATVYTVAASNSRLKRPKNLLTFSPTNETYAEFTAGIMRTDNAFALYQSGGATTSDFISRLSSFIPNFESYPIRADNIAADVAAALAKRKSNYIVLAFDFETSRVFKESGALLPTAPEIKYYGFSSIQSQNFQFPKLIEIVYPDINFSENLYMYGAVSDPTAYIFAEIVRYISQKGTADVGITAPLDFNANNVRINFPLMVMEYSSGNWRVSRTAHRTV